MSEIGACIGMDKASVIGSGKFVIPGHEIFFRCDIYNTNHSQLSIFEETRGTVTAS